MVGVLRHQHCDAHPHPSVGLVLVRDLADGLGRGGTVPSEQGVHQGIDPAVSNFHSAAAADALRRRGRLS